MFEIGDNVNIKNEVLKGVITGKHEKQYLVKTQLFERWCGEKSLTLAGTIREEENKTITKEEFDKLYIGEKIAVFCSSLELIKELESQARSFGYTCIGGMEYDNYKTFHKSKKPKFDILIVQWLGEAEFFESEGYKIVKFKSLKKENVIPTAKFKNGASVLFKDKAFEITGITTVCINKEPQWFLYDIKNENEEKSRISEMELTEVSKEKNVPKFKAGDEVFTKCRIYFDENVLSFTILAEDGDLGVVLKNHEIYKERYLVNFCGNETWIEGKCLELASISPKEEVNFKVELHEKICKELNAIYKAKNADYGDSFSKVRQIVPNAILVRLNDKIQRLNKLMTTDEHNVKSESIRDSFIDLANYCILELIEMEGEK